ncbi:MAG TPA: prepilin-type N-terminal cleavage/methylation domain-containing protein [Planctomycetota bacterium]
MLCHPLTLTPVRRRARAFTLIELLVVMGIILLMVGIALVSVNSMLRSSRMSRAVGLMLAAVDESRTMGMTVRSTTQVDVTRIDQEGSTNRLSVTQPYFDDGFESYTPYGPNDPTPVNNPAVQNWVSGDSGKIYVENDGTRCMLVRSGFWYFNVTGKVESQGDFETNISARVKFLPVDAAKVAAQRWLQVVGAAKYSGAIVTGGYGVTLKILPMPGALGRNAASSIFLAAAGTPMPGNYQALTGSTRIPPLQPNLVVDNSTGFAPGYTPMTSLVQGVWYRVSLLIKKITDVDPKVGARVILSAKVWADGQMEPSDWTVGPLQDTGSADTAQNGPGAFICGGGDIHVDDVKYDVRPIRYFPQGIRIDAMAAKPLVPDPINASDWDIASPDSPVNFPLSFRPDGTCGQRYLLRFTDTTTGDRRWVSIDQNTGRARAEHTIDKAIAK